MSFIIRKFFEGESPVAEGGGFNLAAMMAKSGVKSESGELGVATPLNIQTETKETPVAQEPANAAMATASSEGDKGNLETPTQTAAPAAAPEPQKVEVQPKQPSLQEVLKSTQPEAVLKAMGFDDKAVRLLNELNGFEKIDFFANFVNEWKTKGNPTSYLQEMVTDYSKMPAEEVMRHQLRQEYPTASAEAINALFKREVVNAYNLNSDDEAERAEGQLLLEAKADRFRATLLQQQQQRLLPAPPEPQQPKPDPVAEAQAKMQQEINRQINESSFTKNIFATNNLSLADGFNYPVNPQKLLEVMIEGDKNGDLLFNISKNADGSESLIPNVEKQFLVAAVTLHGMDFLNKYAEHYKGLGGKTITETIDNAKPPGVTAPASGTQAPPKTAAEAMARQGAYNSGGR